MVGSSRDVTVKLSDPLKVATEGMVPEPVCAAGCEYTFYECYANCDENGPGCPWCQTEYTSCLLFCPQVCVEPKSVYYTYTAWALTSTSNLGNICVGNASAYVLFQQFFRRSKYQRTVHCDDSYTDVFVNYEYQYSYCKQYLGPGCTGNYTPLPPNC